MIIDTPGMREIQLWADNVTLSHSFQDIELLAASCKFSDCKHSTEPGCSITNAVANGNLESQRLARYFKLSQELEHFDGQQNDATRTRRKQQYKRFSKLSSKRPHKKG
jgi:ribosome biogenesis GTPase